MLYLVDNMLLFGHTGITLGLAALIRKGAKTQSSVPVQNKSSLFSWHRFSDVFNRLDMRIVIIGSVLPDIIDKPIGIWLLKDSFSNGRIIGHTLLFFAALAIAGVYFSRRRLTTWPLALAFGTITHLVFDQMWRLPHTLFWPIFGFTFDKKDVSGWVSETLNSLLTNPADYVPELIGIAILIWYAVTLIRQKKLRRFLKTGEL